MSVMLGVGIGLFARSLLKSGGDVLLNGEESLLKLFKQELVSASAEGMPEFIKNIIDRLNLRRVSKEKLLNGGNIIDLAGIAWADVLAEQPDDLVSRCTNIDTARELVKRLDPYWFIDAVTSVRATTIQLPFSLGQKEATDNFEASLLANLVGIVSAEIKDELDLNEETTPRPLVEKVVARIPERISELWISIPGIEARITRLNTDEILKYVSGSVDKDDMRRALFVIAQKYIDSLNGDVFGREVAQPNEPPILTHKATYVEPEAVLKLARVTSKSPPENKGPVKTLVRNLWVPDSKTQLIMLHAPFGYGKTLTFKSLAADLARDWQKDPENAPFPVLLRCPDVLSRHVSTLKAAVQGSIEKQTRLAQSAVEKIWSTHRLVLLLDSFDEVHMSEKEAKGWIEEMQQVSNEDRVRVVVASRPHAFKSKWLGTNDWEIEIQPFDEKRGQQWLDAVAGRLGPRDLTFREISSTLDPALAGTPILLVMAAYGWSDNATSKPNSKAAIYRRFIEKISTGKWADVQEAHSVVLHGIDVLNEVAGPSAFRKALRLLAWEYLRAEQRARDRDDEDERDSTGLSRRQVSEALQANFSGIGEEQIDVITHSLCLSLFLHKAAGTESVVFTHRSFREYLCAEYAVDALRTGRHSNSHYFSHAWRLMAEVYMGEAELVFSGELLQELDAAERALIIKQLDGWYRETRSVFFKEKGGLRIEKAEPDVEIGLAPHESDRYPAFHSNVQGVGLAGRGVSLAKLQMIQRFVRVHREQYLLDDDGCRVLRLFEGRGRGEIWAQGYYVETGDMVLISPIGEIDNYRESFKKAPELFAPIVHVSKSYFACSVPGMRVQFHFPHDVHDVEQHVELVRFGRFLAQADEAGVAVSHLSLSVVAFARDDRFLLGFFSSDGGVGMDLKQWWSNRALSFVADFITLSSGGEYSVSLELKEALVLELQKCLRVLALWERHSWGKLFESYDAIVGLIRSADIKRLDGGVGVEDE